MEHSGSGKRGASADRKRVLRMPFTNSQQAPFGTIETACHFLFSTIAELRMSTSK
jgi:hypothetical protein